MTWPIKKLGEVIDINFGERITRTNNSGNKYPVYGGGGESFRTDKFNREDEYVVSRFAIAENCVRFVEGRFWLMDSGGTFSIKKDFTDKLDKNFVGNVLLMKQKEIYNCARGGAQKNIDVDFFKKIKIPLPPLATQKQIVNRLDKIAEAQKLNDELVQKTDELFQSLLHKELNPVGKDWEVKKLGEICEFHNGKAHEPIIVENGKYIVVNSKFIASDAKIVKYSDRNLVPLMIGDVAIVMSDVPNGKSLAKCFLVNQDDKFTLNQRIGLIRTDKLDRLLLYYQLNRNKYFLRFDNGQSQTNLRKNEILNCPISIPKITEQKQIVAKLSAVQNYKKQLLEQKAKLKELFDSALARSMNSGQVKSMKN